MLRGSRNMAKISLCFFFGKYWIIFLVLVLLKCSYSQKYVGDTCTLLHTNKPGECKFLLNCPSAIDNLHSKNVRPQTCGFDGLHPIVCCPEKERKSKQKCKEYSDGHWKKNSANLLLPNPHYPTSEASLPTGNKARTREFPHMAAIGYENFHGEKEWLCSGVLISEQFVLSAAHCLTDRPHGTPKFIRLGDLLLDNDHDDANPQEFNVAEIFKHPKFLSPSFYNDIGLIKMDRKAKFDSYTRPACLDQNPPLTTTAVFTAWTDDKANPNIGHRLTKIYVDYFPYNECKHLYKNASFTHRLKEGVLNEIQLCAVPQEQPDTCVLGTGVLQVQNEKEHFMYTVVGVSSFGTGCEIPEIPDVFTRVSAYIDWIEEIVWPS